MHSSVMCTVCCSGCVEEGVSSGGVWPGGVRVSAKGVSAPPKEGVCLGVSFPGGGVCLWGRMTVNRMTDRQV